MKFSIIVPSLDGAIPESLSRCVAKYREKAKDNADLWEIELVVIKGVSPVGKARNLGLKRATGDYIAWMDADDEVSENWLEEILVACSAKGGEVETDVVVIDYVAQSGDWHKDVVWSPSSRGLLADLLSGRLSPECWRYVLRHSLWEGIFFDESSEVAEDYRIMPSVLRRARSFAHVGILYHYHINESSLMHNITKERAIACMKAVEDRLVEFRGTEWEADACADTIRWAGWLFEIGKMRDEARHFLSRNLLTAWCCPRLNLWWKIKVPLLLLGFEPILRRLYRYPKLKFWK